MVLGMVNKITIIGGNISVLSSAYYLAKKDIHVTCVNTPGFLLFMMVRRKRVFLWNVKVTKVSLYLQ